MKVALLCFLLFGVCLAQTFQSGETLSLTRTVTAGRHEEYSDSVDDAVAPSGCRRTVHTVNGVRTNNGPLNSGAWFTVEIQNTGDQTVFYTFGTENDLDDDDATTLFEITVIPGDGDTDDNFIGSCNTGDTCTFVYKCKQYQSITPLEVVTYTSDNNDDSDEPVTYTLTVTQLIEEVDSIGRTFTESGVTVTIDSTRTIPSNYAQYYHDFDGTLAETGKNTVFYVIASDFDAAYDGDVAVCVSFTSMVSNDGSDADDNDPLNELDPADTFATITEEGCTSYCRKAPISTEGDFVYLAINFCDLGLCSATDMWIGVQPESGEETGFKLTLTPDANTLPVLIQVEETPFAAEGEVSDECLTDEFDYSCENYYVINADTDFDTPTDARLGPFLSVNVYGPLGGDVEVILSSGVIGGENECDGCPSVEVGACASLSGDGDISCLITVPSCQFDASAQYVATVTGSQNSAQFTGNNAQPIDYGIEIKLDSYTVEEVNPISTVFGKASPGQQNHYTVTFDESEINSDTYFEVEMYIRNSDGDNVAMAWNFNEPAGDGTCFQSLGRCQTDLACDDFIAGDTLAVGTIPTCRFVYEDCNASVSEVFARTGAENVASTSGLRVSQLRAGTYWFNVYHLVSSGSFDNVDNTVEYTLKFNLRRSIPVFDNLVVLGHVFFAENTPQYVYNIPNTPGIRDIIVTIDNVRNGGVTLFVECGSRAGTCPCGTFFQSVAASQGAMSNGRAQVTVPVCQCDSDTLNIVVAGTTDNSGDNTDNSEAFNENQPIFFAMSVDAFAAELEVLPLPATRAGTTASGTITQFGPTGLTQRDQITQDTFLYELTFDNVDIASNDALFLTLDVVMETSAPDGDADYLLMSVGDHAVYDLESSTAQLCEQQFCYAEANFNVNTPTFPGLFSTCTIAIQPCSVNCGKSATGFDSSRRYIVSIIAPLRNLDEDRMLFSLTAQVVGNVPVPLQVDIPMRAEHLPQQYNHFSVAVAGSPTNSRLVMEAYTDASALPMNFWANYNSGMGTIVPAGDSSDCFGHSFCYVCEIGLSGNNRCGYEVPPCVLSNQEGTYFLSVNNPDSTTNIVGYGFYESEGALPTVVDFTIEARYLPIINVVESNQVLVGTLSAYETAYYRINVPQGDLDLLRFEFEATSPSVQVAVSTVMPDLQCSGCSGFVAAAEGTALRSILYPCDLPEETLYLSVSVDSGIDRDACDQFDYILHAHTSEATERIISLSNDPSDFVKRSFNSLDDSSFEFILADREFVVYKFSATSVSAGDFLVIETEQVDADGQEYNVYLSRDTPFFPAAGETIDFFGVAASDSDCGTSIASCEGDDFDGDVCQMVVEPCGFASGTYYLTFSGIPVGLNQATEDISIRIRHFGVEEIDDVPTDDSAATNAFADDSIFDDVNRRSFVTPRLSLDGGESLTFQSDNGRMFITRGTETDSSCGSLCTNTDSCTLRACDDVSSAEFYIFVDQLDDNDVSVTITITQESGNSAGSLSTIRLSSNDPEEGDALTGESDDTDAEFQYYTFSVDGSSAGRFELEFQGDDINIDDLYFVDEPTYFPGFTAPGADEFVIFSSGDTGTTCGFRQLSEVSGECCYADQDFTFAVVGVSQTYTLTVVEEEFGSNPSGISLPEDISGVLEADDDFDFDQYTFTLDSDQALFYNFDVTEGEAILYLNQGNTAGSGSGDDSDPSRCYQNNADFTCDSPPCTEYISPCNSGACASSSGEVTYTIAVVRDSDVAARYTLNIIDVDYVQNIGNSNDDLDFPSFDADDIDLSDLDIRSVFRYQTPTDIRSANTIPVNNDLGISDDLYPRLTFNFTNFRDSDGAPARPGQVTINTSGSALGCDLTELSDTFCDAALEENNDFILCSRSACAINCDDEIFFTITSNDDDDDDDSNDNDRYEFDLDVIEEFDDIDALDNEFDTDSLTVSSGTSTSSATYDDQDENPIYSVFISTSFPGVDAGEYVVLTLSVDVEDEDDSDFTLHRYSADVCGPAPEQLEDCDLSAGQSCTIVFDPCTSGALGFSDDRTVTYEVRKTNQDGNNWNYSLGFQIISINPTEATLARLDADAPSYIATREITDFTWQFYEFEVDTNDGYTTLSVNVNQIGCVSTDADLDVYYSWGGDDASFADVARPSRFPTEDCNLDAGVSSVLFDTCQFHAGIYRVGVYANEDLQLFDDEDDEDVTTENVILPTVYSISATLKTLPHIEATLGCSLVQLADSSFISRIEIPIEATSQFTRVTFSVEATDDDVTLTVARGGFSEGEGDRCTLSDTTQTSYQCPASAGSTCFINIDSCAFADGLWFAFIEGVATDDDEDDATVTFGSFIETSYIPVFDLSVVDSVDVSANVSPDFQLATDRNTGFVQTYRVLLDGSYEFIVDVPECNQCSLTVNFFYGNRNAASDCNSDLCVPDDFCTGYPCRRVISECEVDSFFVSFNVGSDDNDCQYSMTANRFAPLTSDAEIITPDQIACKTDVCSNLYELRVPGSDIAQEAFTLFVDNESGTDNAQYYFGSDFDCQEPSTCDAGELCSMVFDACNPAEGPFYVFVVVPDCADCGNTENSISVYFTLVDGLEATEIDVDDEPLTAGASLVRFNVPQNDFVNLIGGFEAYTDATSLASSIDAACGGECTRIINGGPEGRSILVSGAESGFAVQTVDVESLNSGEEFDVILNGGGEFVHFSFDIPAGATSVTVTFENVDAGSEDVSSQTLSFDYSTSNLPSVDGGAATLDDCDDTCTDVPTFNPNMCGRSFPNAVIDRSLFCGADRLYFSIAVCSELACPLSMTVVVTADVESVESVTGGDHNDAFTTVNIADNVGLDCNDVEEPENLTFVVDVTSLLFVSIREPANLGNNAEAAVKITNCAGSIGSCVALQTPGGQDSSCAIAADCASYCYPAGSYTIDFSAPIGPGRFEYQIITEWVDLTSSTSDSLYGEAAHFYRVPNTNQALSIALTVTSGPAVVFTVREGCSQSSDIFSERQVCHFGTCHVWIPVRAKSPGQSELYVVIESGLLDAADDAVLTNTEFEKATNYRLEVTRGTANCQTAPTQGFCSDASIGGVNAFASLTNGQVWAYTDMIAKQDQAQCFYERLIQGCPSPSGICREYLKTFACLNTFPQCDASGYQMGVCNDICLQIEDACPGYTLFNDITGGCGTGRFTPASNGTCVTSLPINGPNSAAQQPAARLEAVAEVEALPAQLVVPQFPPLYATLPTLILDDDEDAKMLVQRQVQDSSSSTSLSVTFALIAALLLAF